MLKITKGLKKKKKGKKSKHKEEELFKPEELEAYRREHQAATETASEAETSSAGVENDEWRKFQALTAGVDDILRKTQGDLNRIKSTSFFQRVPTASEVAKAETELLEEEEKYKKSEEDKKTQQEHFEEDIGIVHVSESESEEEPEDDIFDTAFIDAIASGEVKLAYIPESPTYEDAAGDDPFDTSIAERAILGPAVNKKGRKLVPLGAAVEVLTGRVELATCATGKKNTSRRGFQQRDLLLTSFDFDDNGNSASVKDEPSPTQHKSLLDDDAIPLSDAPIDLGTSLHPIDTIVAKDIQAPQTKDILEEFDDIGKKVEPVIDDKPEDDEDDEFALLAAESIAKEKKDTITNVQSDVEDFEQDIEDPFDTTFADNILPGKAELKLIENEILNTIDDVSNQAQIEEKYLKLVNSNVSIHITNPTGDRESVSSLDRIDESSLTSLQPIHRDLLGGSNTDLSNIGDDPITPNQIADDSFSDYSDPFDTSIVDQVSAPGQAELKFIEKELLGESGLKKSLSDPDFDPRADEKEEPTNRPFVLEINAAKNVKFALPSPQSQPDLLATGEEDSKHAKPLTPYYVRENSVPESFEVVKEEIIEDPFDTSFVSELAPGKAELKLIENEFIGQSSVIKIPVDDDFDPRAESKEQQQTNLTSRIIKSFEPEVPKIDLLSASEEVAAKILTPAVENQAEFELLYSDPFDTSIANNILPGKAELKLLENELMHTSLPRNLTDPDFDPRNAIGENKTFETKDLFAQAKVQDLLGRTDESVVAKPLTPLTSVSFEIGDAEEDIDPFDTSVADNLVLGRTELKLLESELI